jgi:hypothetical protein
MQFIIDFVEKTKKTAIDKYIADNKCVVRDVLDKLGDAYLVDAPSKPADAAIVKSIVSDDDGIQLLGELSPVRESKTVSVHDDDNWWKVAVIPKIDYDKDTFKLARGAKGVRVYLMDSGILETHEDFKSKDITLLHSFTGEFADHSGHGTALASVIIGETCGITEAALKVVKIFEPGRPTYVSDILTALQKISEDFSANSNTPSILNMSWAITKNEYVESKIMYLISQGVVCVAAAGNSGVAIPDVSPAAMPLVVTVGAFNQHLTPSDFTNFTGDSAHNFTAGETNAGIGLDLFAPGEHIRVANNDGGYGYSLGTSIAAAITTACVAFTQGTLNHTYDMLDPMTTLEHFQTNFVTRGLLTLEGKYANSPNSIPKCSAKMHELTDGPGVNTAPVRVVALGEKIAVEAFSAINFTSATIEPNELGLTMDGNWIVGMAPKDGIETSKTYTVKVTAKNETQTEIINATIAVYNIKAYPTVTEAYVNSGLVLLSPCCGCASCGLIICCDACNPKTDSGCATCAHVCA